MPDSPTYISTYHSPSIRGCAGVQPGTRNPQNPDETPEAPPNHPNLGMTPQASQRLSVYSNKDQTSDHKNEQPMTKLVGKRHGSAEG